MLPDAIRMYNALKKIRNLFFDYDNPARFMFEIADECLKEGGVCPDPKEVRTEPKKKSPLSLVKK
jgi:hypothetical protein